ncbi:hypothetical protein HYW76_03880 [Candidatus Pacearchaeota archaeon]|nr:hypothetical protein [Candidatus Pacearchaeota archaeon]
MGILKWMHEQGMKESEKMIERVQLAEEIAEEQRKIHTCKVCKAIFSEGIPYQYGMFGKVKSYVCINCAKNMSLR